MANTCNVKECSKCGKIPHEQDSIYGKGQRLFNVGKTSENCTVCGDYPRKIDRQWADNHPANKALGVEVVPQHLRVEKYPHIPTK